VLKPKAVRRIESQRARLGGSGDALDEVMMDLSDDDYRNVLPERYASIDTTDLAVTIDRRSRQIVLALVSATPAK